MISSSQNDYKSSLSVAVVCSGLYVNKMIKGHFAFLMKERTIILNLVDKEGHKAPFNRFLSYKHKIQIFCTNMLLEISMSKQMK